MNHAAHHAFIDKLDMGLDDYMALDAGMQHDMRHKKCAASCTATSIFWLLDARGDACGLT